MHILRPEKLAKVIFLVFLTCTYIKTTSPPLRFPTAPLLRSSAPPSSATTAPQVTAFPFSPAHSDPRDSYVPPVVRRMGHPPHPCMMWPVGGYGCHARGREARRQCARRDAAERQAAAMLKNKYTELARSTGTFPVLRGNPLSPHIRHRQR